jgi:hypothetical protein
VHVPGREGDAAEAGTDHREGGAELAAGEGVDHTFFKACSAHRDDPFCRFDVQPSSLHSLRLVFAV